MQQIISRTKEFFREDLDNPKRELWRGDIKIVEEIKAPKPTKFQIKGRVIDSITKEGLRGVKVSLDKSNTSTQPGGGFTLRITVPVGETPPQNNIDFTLNKYEPKNTPALKLNGTA